MSLSGRITAGRAGKGRVVTDSLELGGDDGAEEGCPHQRRRGHSFTSWVRHVKPPDRGGHHASLVQSFEATYRDNLVDQGL